MPAAVANASVPGCGAAGDGVGMIESEAQPPTMTDAANRMLMVLMRASLAVPTPA